MITYGFRSIQASYLQKRCEEVLAALPARRRKVLARCRIVITDAPLFNPTPQDPTLLGAYGGLRARNIIHVLYLNPGSSRACPAPTPAPSSASSSATSPAPNAGTALTTS